VSAVRHKPAEDVAVILDEDVPPIAHADELAAEHLPPGVEVGRVQRKPTLRVLEVAPDQPDGLSRTPRARRHFPGGEDAVLLVSRRPPL